MAIEKMRLLRMAGSKENIEKILLTAFATNDLHAELASHVVNEGNGGQLLPEDNTFAEFLKRIESMARSLNTQIMCAFDGVTKFTTDEIEMHLLEAESKFEKKTMLSRTVKAATASEENSTILAVCFFSIFHHNLCNSY